MCSGRVDLEFILRAFSKGLDGVFIGGCRLDECNYITHGNYDAWSNTNICKKIMEHMGLNPERLSIKFMSGGDGILLARLVDEFTKKIKDIGPLGEAEGIDRKGLMFKLEAARQLVPYIKLVERERMRVPEKTEELYENFFTSSEFTGLFDELIVNKLTVSQIISLLREGPLTTGEIAGRLGLNPSEVSRQMNTSSRHGLVRYDTERKCYTLA